MPSIVFSVADAYFPAASQELRDAFPGSMVERLGLETGRLMSAADISDVAAACRTRPLVFVRHLVREAAMLPVPGSPDDLDRLISTAIDVLVRHGRPACDDLALQVWTDGVAAPALRGDELRGRIAARLRREGLDVARANREAVLSVCVTPRGAVLGLNRREEALTDWPGGRVGLAKDLGQISRAEFKLEELFKVADVPLPSRGRALDLGASPGGWTRQLRRRGFEVWAIDPGDLDSQLLRDPLVHHLRTTAGRFLAEHDQRFDLVVNDLRMVPSLSCAIMLAAARHLGDGGLVIMTLKLAPRDALRTVRTSLATLRCSYDVLLARQLFHNRNEVTLVARRRPAHRPRTRWSR